MFRKIYEKDILSLTKGIWCIMCLRSVNSYTKINKIAKNYWVPTMGQATYTYTFI